MRGVLAAILCAGASTLLTASCGSAPRVLEDPDVDDGGSVRIDERRYELPADQAWTAVEAVLEEDDGQVRRRRRHDAGVDLLARRADGRRVRVKIRAAGTSAANVAVTVGSPDGALAARIQERIGERLSLNKARADLFAETSFQASYGADLGSCVAAAEETCRAFGLEVLDLEVQDTIARIDARDRWLRSVRFAIRRSEDRDGVTDVVFAVGTTAEGGESEILKDVRREFEHHLFPGSE